MWLTTILEGLQLLDIATTEYAVGKGYGDEVNPLMMNLKKRLAVYPIKLGAPLLLGYADEYAKNALPQYRWITKYIFLGLIGIMGLVGIHNLGVIARAKIEERKG